MTMRLLRTLSVLLLFNLASITVFGQAFYTEDRRRLDSLNALNHYPGTRTKNLGVFRGKAVHQSRVHLGTAVPSRIAASCLDTSSRFFLMADTVSLFTYDPEPTADGHFLVGGEFHRNNPFHGKGLLIKFDYKGQVVWLRTYDSVNYVRNGTTFYYRVRELRDGSILLAGYTSNPATNQDEIIVTRVDALGNLIWSRQYRSRLWQSWGNGSANYSFLQKMEEDPVSGELYICAALWTNGRAIIKLDRNNGDILWSRSYGINGTYFFDAPFGMEITPGEIRIFGKFTDHNSAKISAYRINKSNGDTIESRFYRLSGSNVRGLSFLQAQGMQRLSNGNYALYGSTDGYIPLIAGPGNPLTHAAIVELDSNLNFVRAQGFRNETETNYYNTRLTVYPDGSGVFSMMRFIGGFTGHYYYVQFRNGLIYKQRRLENNGLSVPAENKALRLPDGGDLLARLVGDSAAQRNRYELLSIHASDTGSACLGFNDASTYIVPIAYERFYQGLDSAKQNIYYPVPAKTFHSDTYPVYQIPGCTQVSYCDSLKLIASSNVLCQSGNVDITIRKNRACGASVPLQYPAGVVSSAVALNDSTVRLQFSAPWSGYIRAELPGCVPVQDSVLIQVLASPTILSLGADTVICPGNTLSLNAHSGFASYLWNNGSTDSVLMVTQPGTYFVEASSCGTVFRDTILVLPHPPIPFSAGVDRMKCNDDSVQLAATDGFMNYSWSPAYAISSTSSRSVVVRPLQTTDYIVRAEKRPGCFASDTVRVTVFQSPPIDLGPDRSFCAGDSAVFQAPGGFASYSWSNGQSTNQLTATSAGTYWVEGRTTEGCLSRDTVRVLAVHPHPVVHLDQNPALCAGGSRILDAGPFASYLWNDGSAGQIVTLTGVGTSWVQVWDANGCTGSDTARITAVLPLPTGFLPADTSMCNYGQLLLTSASTFSRYQWSMGGTGPSLTVRQPGIYWLQVEDANRCQGRDTIVVDLKDCLKGLHVPTAFTPNGDGNNDRFKPLLFGDVKLYEVQVYNRWGQVVFQSRDLGQGWNGLVNGKEGPTSVFVWTVRYQLAGEPIQQARGTVTLIR